MRSMGTCGRGLLEGELETSSLWDLAFDVVDFNLAFICYVRFLPTILVRQLTSPQTRCRLRDTE